MHIIRSAMPDPRLKPFVRCFAQREIWGRLRRLLKPPWPRSNTFCLFALAVNHQHITGPAAAPLEPRVNVMGTQTRSPGCFSFAGSVVAFGIFFKPFASWQLFRIPPAEFANQKFEADAVFGPWIAELWLKLADVETFCDRVRVAIETLLPFAQRATSADADDGGCGEPSSSRSFRHAD